MSIDFDAIAAEIGQTVSSILATDIALVRGYSEAKARAIAGFTLMIGESYAGGRLSDAALAEELAELDRMVVRFVRNIAALATTTLERLIGGVAAVLRRVLGLFAVPLNSAALAVPGL